MRPTRCAAAPGVSMPRQPGRRRSGAVPAVPARQAAACCTRHLRHASAAPARRRPGAGGGRGVLGWDGGGQDLALARVFGSAGGFALREQWFLTQVLHEGARRLGYLLLLLLTL